MGLLDTIQKRKSRLSSLSAPWTGMLPDTLIACTDFSDASKRAFIYALEVYKPAIRKVILLNTYSIPSISIGSLVTIKDILYQLSEEGLEQCEDLVNSKFGRGEIEIEKISKAGNISTVLDEIIESNPNSFLSVGTTGASGVDGVEIGSTLSAICNGTCEIPVLCVPQNAEQFKAENILYISDLKELEVVNHLNILLGTSLLTQAEVHIAHVSERNIIQSFNVSAADRDLIPMYSELFPNVPFTYRNLNGVEPIPDQIDQIIREKKVDLIFVILSDDGFLNDIHHEKSSRTKMFSNQLPVISLRLKD